MNEAVDLLNDYNARLAAEMEERTKLAAMLRDFQAEQKELLAQAEQRLDVRCIPKSFYKQFAFAYCIKFDLFAQDISMHFPIFVCVICRSTRRSWPRCWACKRRYTIISPICPI